ncbi:MAG: hypothetical protein IH861_05010 [Chloroflexi bacterium]|nr:hypothetical protein [Chloroflexota bacterium]
MRRTFLSGLFFFLSFVFIGCSTVLSPGNGQLPEGAETAKVPDVDSGGFIYFKSDRPLTLTDEFFRHGDGLLSSQSNDDLTLSLDASTLVLGEKPGEFSGVLSFVSQQDADAAWALYQEHVDDGGIWGKMLSPDIAIAAGDETWIEANKDAFESEDLITLRDLDLQSWNLVTNLPESPPAPPVVIGTLVLGPNLIESAGEQAGLVMDGIDEAFGLVRVERIAFALYTDSSLELSSRIDRQYINDSDSSILLVSHSAYPGPLVSFLLSVIAGRTGMELIEIGNTNARYREIDGLHLIIKNKGSFLYAALSTTRADAVELILSAVAG